MMKEKLGGWMVWDLASDDFTGSFCHAGKYPLIRRLNKALNGEVVKINHGNKYTEINHLFRR